MSYFSRLTDIVTCNLNELLNDAQDPLATIEQILREIEEGVAGAKRSVATAAANVERLVREITEHRNTAASWAMRAKEHLLAGREQEARLALLRKKEVEDLIAGLEHQHQAAVATQEHLATIQRAIEARYAEALRKRAEFQGTALESLPPPSHDRLNQIDAELEALKRELGAGN